MNRHRTEFSRDCALAQDVYQHVTATGQPLQTVTSPRHPSLHFEGRARIGLPRDVRELTTSLYANRTQGSRFLSNSEWDHLIERRHLWPERSLVEQCSVLREGWTFGVPTQKSRIMLFDVRMLQPGLTNGTRHHAVSLLRTFLDVAPEGYDISFLTSPDLPELPNELSRHVTVTWRPALLGDVDVFIQLSTLSEAHDSTNLDVLRAPWIRRVFVFLDDIQGRYPFHFIGTEKQFWMHQVAIEKLRRADVVLSLGNASQREAISLWSSLEPNESQPIFLSTSCVTRFSEKARRSVPDSRNEFVVFGNFLPHKNLALVSAAIGPARRHVSSSATFTFVAELSPSQRATIVDVAGVLDGAGNDAIKFDAKLSDDELASRLGSCRAVIVPSLHEGFSIPVIEAIGMGTPVLLSRIPAHLELLPEGPWFFDPTDVSSLVQSLDEFEREGSAWLIKQQAGLAKKYDPQTMSRVVSQALSEMLIAGPLRTAQEPLRLKPTRERHRRSAEARAVSLAEMEDRDAQLISANLAMHDPRVISESVVSKLTDLARAEHADLVSEFRSSLTWRVGNGLTAPLRLIRKLTGEARRGDK